MLLPTLFALRPDEVRATRVLVGLGALSMFLGFILDFEPLPGMYLGFLGFGLILAGCITIPVNNFLRWLNNGAPDWFQEIGYLLMFLFLTIIVSAVFIIGSKLAKVL